MDIIRQIAILHSLISCQYLNNRVTESDKKAILNFEHKAYCKTNFGPKIVDFVILIEKMPKRLFSLNQEICYYKKTLRWRFCLSKHVLVPCVYMCYMRNYAQPSLFCEKEYKCDFEGKLLVD